MNAYTHSRMHTMHIYTFTHALMYARRYKCTPVHTRLRIHTAKTHISACARCTHIRAYTCTFKQVNPLMHNSIKDVFTIAYLC